MWLNISNINYVNIFYTVAYYNQLHFYVLLKLHSLIIQQGEILPVLSYLVWRLNPYTLPGKMKNDRPSLKENVIDCAFTLRLQQSYREECTWKHISTNTQQLTQQGYWLQYVPHMTTVYLFIASNQSSSKYDAWNGGAQDDLDEKK